MSGDESDRLRLECFQVERAFIDVSLQFVISWPVHLHLAVALED